MAYIQKKILINVSQIPDRDIISTKHEIIKT
jgi:hypothetical protein